MAKTVKIDLRDHAGVPAGGAGMRRDRVTVWAPTFRPATGGDWTVGPQPVEYFFEDGVVNIPNVDAGPLVVRFDVDQMDGTDTFTVTVPAGDGVVTMRELLADEYEYAPIVISEARRVLREARVLLEQSQDSASAAKSSQSAAAGSTSAAASSASAAKSSQEKAAGSASSAASAAAAAKSSQEKAAGSASAAASSAAAAKSSQEKAAGSASAAASSAAAAKSSQGAAATSAAAADHAADRAETVVDTVHWQGDQLSVMGKVSPPLAGEKGDPGAPGSLGITFVESLAEAEALPVGTLYAIVATVTSPPTDPEIQGDQVTVAGIASANANTALIAPTIEEAQPGDTIILAANTKATSKVTLTPPEGFTTAVDGYWVGTQRSWVLHGPYTPGVQFTFSAEQETAWVAIAVRGAQSIDVGTPKGRAEIPADTDTTTTAPAVYKRDLDLVLGLVFERSTATESASQVTVSAGWEKIAWQGHGQNVQTVLAARANASGNLVATYPNPQEQNSMGVQVACRA